MKHEEQVEWAIRGIKELEFMINESVDLDPKVDFKFTVDIAPVIEKESILISITVVYVNTTKKEELLREKVMTIFSIKDMKSRTKFSTDGKPMVDLPEKLWISMFSISFTHTRALLAKSSAGTRFGQMLLPIINPEEQFRKLFGQLLQNKTEVSGKSS
jgi:hypothetical protein